jgi:hypothetical protein
MAISWKQVISDTAQFPDDATFQLGNETVSFRELRRQNAESRGELEQQLQLRSAELDRRDDTQRRAVDTLARVLENVSAATGLTYDQLVSGKIPPHLGQKAMQAIGNTPNSATGLALKDDPLYKPLFAQVLDPIQNDLGIVKTGLGSAIMAYRDDHTRLNWLDYLLTGEKPEGFKSTYEDALQLAVNKNYKDPIGFPDVKRAAMELAGPVKQTADTAKLKKEGYDEGYKKAQSEFLSQLGQPQPGAGGIQFEGAPAKGGPQRVQTIREKLDQAFQDPDIAGTLFTVQ